MGKPSLTLLQKGKTILNPYNPRFHRARASRYYPQCHVRFRPAVTSISVYLYKAMTQTPYRIIPLAQDIANAARWSRVDQFGNRLAVLYDGEAHQCRVCLQLSKPDEGVILMAHRPFASRQPYAETGPIFIHERACVPYGEGNRYPAEFPHHAVMLRAYNDEDAIIGAEMVGEREVERVIVELFENQEIAYLHARNLAYGCFMFAIARA